jgi:fused signal recognition particle receptor
MRVKNLGLGRRLNGLFSGKREGGQILDDVEELLISSDFGIEFTSDVVDELRGRARSGDRNAVVPLLKEIIRERMTLDLPAGGAPGGDARITVYLIFGVNGTGKTTTAGKLAYRLKEEGQKVLIAAADTFRDAAIEQLTVWSTRAGVPLIKQYQGSDPGAVVYDACDSARSRRVNFLIIDTAGRLHNKERLMEELVKIGKVLDRKLPESRKLKLLTLDATTGQNGVSQADLFNRYMGVDGIILTKLDSSAKGGIACSISGKLGIPILYAGVGEGVDDLDPFDVDEYLASLFDDVADNGNEDGVVDP